MPFVSDQPFHATLAGIVSMIVVLFVAGVLWYAFQAPQQTPKAEAPPATIGGNQAFVDNRGGNIYVIEVEGRKFVVVDNHNGVAITPATP